MIRDLAEKLRCSPNDIIKELMDLGVMTTINQSLSFEVASKVADQRGFEVELIKDKSAIDFEEDEKENPKRPLQPTTNSNNYGTCGPWKNIIARCYKKN